MLSLVEQKKILDKFYFDEVIPRMHPALQALAADSRILHHSENTTPLDTVVGKIAVEYWTNPWKLDDIFPVKPEEQSHVAQGMALVFLGYLVIDNLVDSQTPDNALIPLLSHQLMLEATEHFARLFEHHDSFWTAYYACVRSFIDGLAIEYDSVVAHRTFLTPDMMQVIDKGKAFTFRIECNALGRLCGREELIEPISSVFELLTLADQFGDDAIDWHEDYRMQRATMPVVLLAQVENLPLATIFSMEQDELEDHLNRHRILHQMIDYAHQYLYEAKSLLPAEFAATWLGQFIDSRIEDEHKRKRSFSAIAFVRSLSKGLQK